MEKKLYKSRTNYVIAGVAGGLGDYFDIDPTLVRLGFVLFTFAGGAGPLIYIILMIILPEGPDIGSQISDVRSQQNTINNMEAAEDEKPIIKEDENKALNIEKEEIRTREVPERRNTLALILIGVGLVALFNQIRPLAWMTWDNLWPALLIFFGIYFIVKK